MRRVVFIVPDLLGEPSVVRQKLPTLQRMAEMGRLIKIQPMPNVETPEAMYLGMRPDQGQLRQGPLTVAALGADPPDRSTHFHLSLMSHHDGVATQPNVQITPEEQAEVMELATKLNTKSLTLVLGEQLDHGLVWENIGDLQTTAARDVDGKRIRPHLPEGDAEVPLRRFIDDSINLLSETEMNQRRIDEELSPVNLLWPWGHGIRTPVPNLALRRGEPALVISNSLRMQGLTRLAGYRHDDREKYGKGLNTRLSKVLESAFREKLLIVALDSFSDFRQSSKFEEAEWLAKELDSTLLEPLFNLALEAPTRITLLAPSQVPGLGVIYQNKDAGSNSLPFDERALDERLLSTSTLWDGVAAAIE